jgi:hypothetical protein
MRTAIMASTRLGAVPRCPETLTQDLEILIEQFAVLWQASSERPRVLHGCAERWTALVNEWITAVDLPLLIRAGAGRRRGQELVHASGRLVVCADNSPAHWAMSLALQGECPTLDDIRALFAADRVPVCMAMSGTERLNAKYRCNRQKINLNTLGWKVCHRERVGERRPQISELASWERITSHFRRFVSPANMFLVPKKWAGLGELMNVINVFGQRP